MNNRELNYELRSRWIHCSPSPVKLMDLSPLVQQEEYNLPVGEKNQICDKQQGEIEIRCTYVHYTDEKKKKKAPRPGIEPGSSA